MPGHHIYRTNPEPCPIVRKSTVGSRNLMNNNNTATLLIVWIRRRRRASNAPRISSLRASCPENAPNSFSCIMIEIRLIIQLGKFSALCLLQKINAGLQLMEARTRGICVIQNGSLRQLPFERNASFYPSRSFSPLYPS